MTTRSDSSLFPICSRWTHEDWTTSEGKTRDVILNGLPDEAKSACGEYVCVGGRQALNGQFYFTPFEDGVCNTYSYPHLNKCLLPDERFVQVQAYQVIDEVLRAIGRQIDIKTILGTDSKGVLNRVKVHIAGSSEFNAWYSRYSNSLTFGTGKGIWYLGGCIDIILHEFGHYVLDHINRYLLSYYGEGGAIHEGFADFFAAAIANDPEIGEDFLLAYHYYKKTAINLSKHPDDYMFAGYMPSTDSTPTPDKDKGLRTVANNLTLQTAGSEVHDRGRVYGGFFWSLRQRLIEQAPYYFGANDGRVASTAVLKLALHHCTTYQVNTPQPADFVEAMIRAVDRLFAIDYRDASGIGKTRIDADTVKDMIRKEAVKRGIVTRSGYDELVERMSTGGRFANVNEVLSHLKRYYAADFARPESVARPFADGEMQKFYQQIVTVNINGRQETVELLGHGFYERDETTRFGKRKVFLTNGVRNMRTAQIDTNINIGESEAMRILFDFSTLMYGRLQEMNEAARKGVSMPTLDRESIDALPYQDFAYMDANEMILKDVLETLAGKREMFTRKFVILPNADHISYEFRTKLASVFIDAKTGRLIVRSNIFIDNWLTN